MCKEKRECKHCGAEYSPKQPHQKFCSKKCSSGHHRAKAGYEKVKIKEEVRQCDNCGCDFQWTSRASNQRFCSSECAREVHCPKALTEETRKCDHCGSDFAWSTKAPNKKFCSVSCRKKSYSSETREPRAEDKRVEYDQCRIEDKHYVYGWYDGDLLFYVGKGIGLRHKVRHKRSDGTDAWCETVKRNAKNFKCLILRTGLTERESRIVESTLITVCKPYTNVSQRSI